MGKTAWGISVLAAALVGAGAGWWIRSRQEPAASGPSTPTQAVSDVSCLADERASRGAWMSKGDAVKPPTAPVPPGGAIRGRLTLPWQERKKTSYAYAVYAFGADGQLEGPKNFANTDRFEMSGLSAGRKAILFYPLLENLSFPYQVVDVPASGEVDVALRPRIPYLLSGRVVDANGSGVGGVTVVVHESIALPGELYLQGRPSKAAVLEKTSEAVVTPVGPAIEEIVSTYVRIDPLAGRLSRGVTTDAKGAFRLPVTSPTDPVPVTIQRSPTDVIKEETLLPSGLEHRVVIPNQ